jgi:L-aspartate oxidase
MIISDFLVIGGGIAGLTFALQAAEHGSVNVLCKTSAQEGSTAWAQGGIAAVASQDDSSELHVQDTLIAGAGLCHQSIVEMVVGEGPERIRDLIGYGVAFDRENDSFHLHREGGHSRRRIYHVADATGREIQNKLSTAARERANIRFFEHTMAIDLVTSRTVGIDFHRPNRVLGAYVLMADGKVELFRADKVVLATGGAGKVYLYTSNPDIASGDGIAMAYRAGCAVANMEFFQFHPTCLFEPKAKSFLITEAMRGEGATLKRVDGTSFMREYDTREELAPRDVVARAIDFEMKKTGDEYVLLDISQKGEGFVREHFPTIYERCLSFGINCGTGPIPVVPAAHFCCGGILTDSWGATSIEGLYAVGECASTGLHGANRLASNSLLEGVVFGHRAAQHALERLAPTEPAPQILEWDDSGSVRSDEAVIISQNWDEIRRFMWNYVGIVRSDKRLERALRRSEVIEQEIREYYWNFTVTKNLLELRNLSLVANLVIRCAMARKESRGLHFTIDHPESTEKGGTDTILMP